MRPVVEPVVRSLDNLAASAAVCPAGSEPGSGARGTVSSVISNLPQVLHCMSNIEFST